MHVNRIESRFVADRVQAFDFDPPQEVMDAAMMASLLATVNPGKRVVIFEPFCENFGPDDVVSGASPLWVPMQAPDFQPDAEALKAAAQLNAKP